MTIAIVAATGCILAFEIAAWWLFDRKIEGLSFPAATDGSDLPLFTIQRLRLIAITHGIVLIAVCILTLLFLW